MTRKTAAAASDPAADPAADTDPTAAAATDTSPSQDEAPTTSPTLPDVVDPVAHAKLIDQAAVRSEPTVDEVLPSIDTTGWTDEQVAAALASRGLPTDGDRDALTARLELAVADARADTTS